MATSDLLAPTTTATAPPGTVPAATGGGRPASGHDGFHPFGEDGFTFADLLDVVNPLQHIPIIGTLYRHITGDALSPAARLAGGTLFGGAIGAALAGANIVVEDATGKDIGDQVLALFSGGSESVPATAVAAAETSKPTPPAEDAKRPGPPVPDLALLGPLPALPGRPTPAPAVQTAAVPEAPAPLPEPPTAAPAEATASVVMPPVIALAALAPLAAPAAGRKPEAEPPAATVAAIPATPPSPAAETPAVRVDTVARSPSRRAAELTPPGAAAVEGGWFTQTMLSALEKYQQAARLSEKDAETAAVTVNN